MVRHGIYISKDRIVRTYKCGYLHSEKHAAMYFNDGKTQFEYWYKDGKLHRLNGPAIQNCDQGYVHSYWYFNGKQHREDGPSILFKNKEVETLQDWFLHGARVPGCKSVYDLKKFKLKAFL